MKRLLRVVVCVVMILTMMGDISLVAAKDLTMPQSTIVINFERAAVPQVMRAAITRAILNKPQGLLEGSRFDIVSLRLEEGWALASLAVMDDLFLEEIGMGDNGALIILREKASDQWEAVLEGTAAFEAMLSIVPQHILSPLAHQALISSRTPQQGIQTVEMNFPWNSGQSWMLTQGWHYTTAVDFAPATGASDQQVLAAHDGVVTRFCIGTYGSSLQIMHSDGTTTKYLHLANNSVPGGILGQYISRGTVIGVLYPYAYNQDGCGYSTGAHLHFVLPSQTTTVDGWTPNSSNVWSKNGTTKTVGDWFTSSNMLQIYTISGVVRDEGYVGIPGVTVNIRNVQTNQVRTAQSSANPGGAWLLNGFANGQYEVSYSKADYQSFTTDNIQVQNNDVTITNAYIFPEVAQYGYKFITLFLMENVQTEPVSIQIRAFSSP